MRQRFNDNTVAKTGLQLLFTGTCDMTLTTDQALT